MCKAFEQCGEISIAVVTVLNVIVVAVVTYVDAVAVTACSGAMLDADSPYVS